MAALSRRAAGCGRFWASFCRHRSLSLVPRRGTITGNPRADKTLNTLTSGKIGGWLKTYENMVGLTEVRSAQDKVIQAERIFIDAQAERTRFQDRMQNVHRSLSQISTQLDKVQRGDQKYLNLLTEEYQIIVEKDKLEDELSRIEQTERDTFATLSSAVRESHEKERVRTERTKYWSIIGSVIGAIVGILGTSINNYMRMRQIRGIVTDSAAGGVELKGLVAELSDTMSSQHNQMQGFVGDLKGIVTNAGISGSTATAGVSSRVKPVTEKLTADTEQLEVKTQQIMDRIKCQEKTIEKEMGEIKKFLGTSQATDQEGNIVYVGPEMQDMLEKAENNLEWKIKVNALWSITFIYGAFALTLPVLYAIFRGSS